MGECYQGKVNFRSSLEPIFLPQHNQLQHTKAIISIRTLQNAADIFKD